VEVGLIVLGGYITLVNGSPYDWTLTGQHSYQMSTWNWPTISAGMNTNDLNDQVEGRVFII